MQDLFLQVSDMPAAQEAGAEAGGLPQQQQPAQQQQQHEQQPGFNMPIEGKTIKALTTLHLKRTYDMFAGDLGQHAPLHEDGQKLKASCKMRDEYESVMHLDAPAAVSRGQAASGKPAANGGAITAGHPGGTSSALTAPSTTKTPSLPPSSALALPSSAGQGGALVPAGPNQPLAAVQAAQKQREIMRVIEDKGNTSAAVSRRMASKWPKPAWHPPWKLYRVVSGHLGWVRSLAVDPGNEYFATGSGDRTIKIWDLASGQLKLTLTGHIEQVTGLAISPRHPYMFSCGLDKMVKCWDLEQNKVIRHYHGHLSGVYSLALHPKLDVLMTGGRDSVCRVWDMRTKVQVHCLSGHDQTVCSILSQPGDPQVITGSHDSTIRLWDLRTAKTMSTLTFHKKSVRAMALHPFEHAFGSASADNIKKFALPRGEFLHNTLIPQRAIVNAMAINQDNVMVTGGDNGSLWFWDWTSGHCFQQNETLVQPGSLEAEAGINAAGFDVSGSRLITCESDKTIKMWKEDEEATEATHPGLPFRPPRDIKRF